MMRKLMAAALLAALAVPAQAKWVTSWAAAPVNPSPARGPFPATPTYDNITLRQLVTLSAGGTAVRVRLSNAHGESPLAIGAARIALLGPDEFELPATSRILTFGGRPSASIAIGAPLVSDSVTLAIPPGARLAVTLYLPDETGPCTCHPVGLDSLEISAAGDHSAAPFRPERTADNRAFLAAVEVDAPRATRGIIVLGDSISDGVGSGMGADRRWPDLLARRLGRNWAVANQGISGNRVVNDGAGISALARLDRDVLSLPGVDTLIILEGVNDLGVAYGNITGPLADIIRVTPRDRITDADIIAAYRQIIARARARNVRVIGATILPYGGSFYWSPEGEAARQRVNAFIRDSGEFDGVIDFDAAVRDPADPTRMRAGLHSGDFLHGSNEGYRVMAEAIPLSLFR